MVEPEGQASTLDPDLANGVICSLSPEKSPVGALESATLGNHISRLPTRRPQRIRIEAGGWLVAVWLDRDELHGRVALGCTMAVEPTLYVSLQHAHRIQGSGAGEHDAVHGCRPLVDGTLPYMDTKLWGELLKEGELSRCHVVKC